MNHNAVIVEQTNVSADGNVMHFSKELGGFPAAPTHDDLATDPTSLGGGENDAQKQVQIVTDACEIIDLISPALAHEIT